MIEVNYAQTWEERYETDVNERVMEALRAVGAPIVGAEGGSGFGPGLVADNHVILDLPDDLDDDRREQIRVVVAAIVDHPETIVIGSIEDY